ncbi:MAG: FMN-binding negative transcriptional regulator [Chloroflexi bacterium]|nr:FMN-binding negative transcriptional regulator [Chloroflexota bacterium]
MYIPAHFKQDDAAEIARLIGDFPLACIVAVQDGKLTANHVPMLLAGDPTAGSQLIGHLAKANPLWQLAGSEVLAIFQGPTAYITPTWYPTKQQTHQTVPTYNYASVHIYGPLIVSHEEADKRYAIELLTNKLEQPRSAPWHVDDAPADYVQQLMKGTVAIRVEITGVQGKWKASQNRPMPDRQGVIAGLLTDSTDSQAGLMSELVKQAAEK